ncbi:MAG TPA: acyl-CoA dehydrogenase family protein, partial [Longimicrobiales bacterium]|nr:acyl-CoA dehydrogenase family protein [Longimicrobiales bacterium]
MPDASFLRWPFFEDEHRALHWGLSHWRVPGLEDVEPADVDAAARRLVRLLGEGGWLRYVVPAEFGGLSSRFDVRSLCLIRETLAYQSGLADFAFAMQGLGTGSITLFGSDELKRKYLPPVAQGEAIAAFAISEAEAGSDVSAMQTSAEVSGEGWVINGEKTWISNAGIADHYVVFCRIPEGGEKSYGAFIVDADNPGVKVSERIRVIAPHVLGTLRFENCKVSAGAIIGAPGAGLKIALATLDVFRTTVAAAALGFARRALDEAVHFTRQRKGFGRTIADMQLTQARIAEMAVAIDAAALLIYRAAWAKDNGETRITREAAMAKLFATESAQKVIDDAVQLHGGRGVVHGEVVERLYREIRSLRIYEGT